MQDKIRINKYLSLCGLGSRRKVEDIISSGRISINGRIDKNLHNMVECGCDIIKFDGRQISPAEERFYIILNKPKGYITSLSDVRGRPVVMDLLPEKFKRLSVFPVGRLDMDTEGLLFFTNDGYLAYCLTHPKFGVSKEYIVKIGKPLAEGDRLRIEKGVMIDGKRTAPAVVRFADKSKCVVRIIIREGKKRQIRLTFEGLGYRVKGLKRIAFGPLKLGAIESGSFRALREPEIKSLKKCIPERV